MISTKARGLTLLNGGAFSKPKESLPVDLEMKKNEILVCARLFLTSRYTYLQIVCSLQWHSMHARPFNANARDLTLFD